MATQKRPVVSDLDFASIKEDLISHFKSREEFKDYEFTGSGLNLLMDILAYNTHYNALTANMLLNEMFLDSALLRANVVSLAKSLNYTPRSAQCATSVVTYSVTNPGSPYYAVIPAGTSFSVSGGGSTLDFKTLIPYTVQFDSSDAVDLVKTVQMVVYEGTSIQQRYVHTAANKQRAFDLGNNSIDTTTISVSVNGQKYTQLTPEKEGIVGVTGESLIFYVEETRNQTHRIVFGNGRVGKALEPDDEILVSYQISSGESGNGLNITGPNVVSATTTSGGSAPETIREIRTNAPRWYQSQYRAVTENDYEVFLRKKYANIQAISVYGGEKVGSPGKVFICIKPKTGDYLQDSIKSALVNGLIAESNVVTVTPVIVDPTYINLVLKTAVIYDETQLVTSPEYIQTLTTELFNTFNTSYLGEFLKTFRVSQLSDEIKGLEDSIVGSNSRVTLRIDNNAFNQKLDSYAISFGNKLYHPEDGFKSKTGGVVYTAPFYRVGKSYTSGFDDDGFGNLRLYDLIDGVKVTVNEKAGVINYDTGKVEILINLDPADGVIKFYAIPDSFDVVSEGNIILRISASESKIIAIEQNNAQAQKSINLSRSI